MIKTMYRDEVMFDKVPLLTSDFRGKVTLKLTCLCLNEKI